LILQTFQTGKNISVDLCSSGYSLLDLFRRRFALWQRVGWLLIMGFVIPMGGLIYWLVRYAVWTLEMEALDLAEGNAAQ
jgi:hypothetical protein